MHITAENAFSQLSVIVSPITERFVCLYNWTIKSTYFIMYRKHVAAHIIDTYHVYYA